MARFRNDDEHPAQERVRLSWSEQYHWAQFVNKELRHDAVSRLARQGIRDVLDASAVEGTWCACEVHTDAIQTCVAYLWKDSEPSGGVWLSPPG